VRSIFQLLPLFVVLYVVVSIIRAAAKAAKNQEQRRERGHAAFDRQDPEEAQRTRRIQEEIRRKIAERRGGVPPRAEEPVREVVVDTRTVIAPPLPRTEPQRATERPEFSAAVLERQAQLAEQMRQLAADRALRERKAAELAAVAESERQEARDTHVIRGTLLSELQDATTARRAILLREILGTPVGLR
jgi:hypothetical protein